MEPTSKEWSDPWAPRLWKLWTTAALGSTVLVFVLLGVINNTSLSQPTLNFLATRPGWPLWVIVAALAATALTVGALSILAHQILDRWRIHELESLREKRDDARQESRKSLRDLENLTGMFRDQERLRMIDPVTGVPNYQSWQVDLTKWAAARRSEKDFSLILIDMDGLRWLNRQSRDCADEVLRFFAQTTYESMRRDEQLYKIPELATGVVAEDDTLRPTAMYRHYQGGDEFFFIVGGNVYEAIGFANRLADRVNDEHPRLSERVLRKYLKDRDLDEFRLSFSGSVIPIVAGTETETALQNAYTVMSRAKDSKDSRLLVVFEGPFELPVSRRKELEEDLEHLRRRITALKELRQRSPDDQQLAKQLDSLVRDERTLERNIGILKKSEILFDPRKIRRYGTTD